MTAPTYFTLTGSWVPDTNKGYISGTASIQMLVGSGDVLPTSLGGVIVPHLIPAKIANGVLCDQTGRPGVSLVANTVDLNLSTALYYTVVFSLTYHPVSGLAQSIKVNPVTFTAPTSATTIDLGSVTPAAGVEAGQVVSVGSANITDATTVGRALIVATDASTARTVIGAAGVPAAGMVKSTGTALTPAVSGTDYGTYSKPGSGIPSTDMASAVQTSLGLANTALQPSAVVNNTDGTVSVNSVNTLEPLSTVTIATTSAAPAIGQTTYYNATSGNLTPSLPALSGLRVGARLAVRRDPADTSLNTVTLSCAGSDAFYSSGATTSTFPLSGEQREFQVISVSGTKYWAPAGALNPISALDKRYASLAAHTLGGSYRPLRGVTSAIGSSIVSGTDATGVGSIIGWASAAGKYRFVGMVPGASGAGATWCQNNNDNPTVTGVNSLYSPITVEFWSNATNISVYFSAENQPDVWAIVDDQRIQNDWQHVNFATGPVTWKLTQSSAVWRKYRLCMGFSWLQGIAINSGASIVPTTPGFQLAVVGDSYVTGGVFEANAIMPGVSGTIAAGTLIGELEQITGLDIWRFGIGGTGYVAAAGYTGGNYGSTQRVGYFAGITNKFHACLIYGGINDWPTSPSTVAAAAQAAWTAWAAAHPEMPPLIVTGFQAGGIAAEYPGGATANNSALKAAAATHPNVGTFIDLLANPYVFGTGYDGSPAGDGNRDVFISADNAHPTHVGARAAGIDLAQKLSQVVLQNAVVV